MTDTIYHRLLHELEEHIPHRHHDHHYDHPETTLEAPVLPIIANIEQEAASIGHDISAELHAVLARHLTVGNMLAHAGQFVQGVEASPVAQALEKYALGPAGEAWVAKVVEDTAGLLQAQAAPVDSTPDVPADPTAP